MVTELMILPGRVVTATLLDAQRLVRLFYPPERRGEERQSELEWNQLNKIKVCMIVLHKYLFPFSIIGNIMDNFKLTPGVWPKRQRTSSMGNKKQTHT